MKKLLKVFAILIGTILLLSILSVFLLTKLINPNFFKPVIVEQVQKYTGREITIDGNLSWSLYPYLGVKVGHVAIGNPPGFNQKLFAEWDNAILGVKLIPLLHKKIESSGITLSGLKLHLVKNAAGKTNWQLSKTSNQPQEISEKLGIIVAIAGVNFSDTSIDWVDEKTKYQINIDQLDLHAQNVVPNQSFPVKVKFRFKDTKLSGKMSFTANVSVDSDERSIRLKSMELIGDLDQKGGHVHLATKANMSIDIENDVAELNDWEGSLNDSRFAGSMKVQNFMEGFQKIMMDGALISKEFLLDRAKISDLTIGLKLRNGILNIAPISASFYQGSMQADAKINLNTVMPEIAVNAKLNNVQMDPLLDDIAPSHQLRLKGIGNIRLQVITAGDNGDALLRNLNGESQFSLSEGVIEGMDINYLIDAGSSIVDRRALSIKNTHQTVFRNLTGTAVIRSGIISNRDLLVSASRFGANGDGVISLPQQQIDYLLSVRVNQTAEEKKNSLVNLYGLAIPIRVTGDLYNPDIGVDAANLTAQIAQKQLEKVAKGVFKIEEQADKKVPNAGEKIFEKLFGQ